MTETTTKAPDDVTAFRDKLEQLGFSVVLDGSPNEWLIDVKKNGRRQEIAWRSDRGFGFFTSGDDVYGDQPSEIVVGVEEAVSVPVSSSISLVPRSLRSRS